MAGRDFPHSDVHTHSLQGEANPRHLLWFAGVSWDDIERANHRMVRALAQYAHILSVDPPLSVVSPKRYRSVARRQFLPRITNVNERITRLTPSPCQARPAQGSDGPPLRSVARRPVGRYVKPAFGRLLWLRLIFMATCSGIGAPTSRTSFTVLMIMSPELNRWECRRSG
jgi:hypothetical protein